MAGWNVMAQVFVRAVGMVSSDIERYSARPGNGTDHREIDSHCLRQNTGFLKAVLYRRRVQSLFSDSRKIFRRSLDRFPQFFGIGRSNLLPHASWRRNPAPIPGPDGVG